MRSIAVSGLVVSILLATGCAKARVTTEIRRDGAVSRSVELTGQEKKQEAMGMGFSIEDGFGIPSGEGWKSTSEKKEATITNTYQRTLALGTPFKGDLSVLGDDGKPALVNEVVVTRLAPHRFEYRETLRWIGTPPDLMKFKPEELANVKAALPQALATDENVRGLGEKAAVLMMPIAFGPGDPLLAIGMLHPDLAAHRANQRIGAVVMKALEEQFGDKLTLEERRTVSKKLIETSFAQAKPTPPDPAKGPGQSKGAGLNPLMFIVKTPGKVISSNGEVDELTGEVYWGMFPPGAALKPVVLTAIVEN